MCLLQACIIACDAGKRAGAGCRATVTSGQDEWLGYDLALSNLTFSGVFPVAVFVRTASVSTRCNVLHKSAVCVALLQRLTLEKCMQSERRVCIMQILKTTMQLMAGVIFSSVMSWDSRVGCLGGLWEGHLAC